MPLYQFREERGQIQRLSFDSAAAAAAGAPEGTTLVGVVVGALPDGSGGVLTDVDGSGFIEWLRSVGVAVAPPSAVQSTPSPASPFVAPPAPVAAGPAPASADATPAPTPAPSPVTDAATGASA